MKTKQQDRALQTPSEANRDKHINYLEQEEKARGIQGKESDKFKKRMENSSSEKRKNK